MRPALDVHSNGPRAGVQELKKKIGEEKLASEGCSSLTIAAISGTASGKIPDLCV